MSKERKPNGYWEKPENVDRAFDEQREELGRTPTSEEFREKYGGALNAIQEKRYHQDVSSWNEYLVHRGIDLNQNQWPPENIDKAFDEQREELGRTPTAEEFGDKNSGALLAIAQKRYHHNVRTWNQYLTHRKIDLNRNQWPPENVDRVFDEQMEELGRTPTYREFRHKNSGALNAIQEKRYHQDVSSWNEYLVHREIKVNKPHRKDNRLEILEDLLEDGE